jgi:hypothetical protein
MILASHGIIQSGGVFIPDADAQAFFDRVTTAGGSLTFTEQLAVNQLVLNMKNNGIWTKMTAIYPFVGASAEACAQNLKSSSFTGTFNGGWTFASTGVKGNNTNTYMQTGVIPLSHLQLNSVHLSNYFRNFTAEAKSQIGVSQSNSDLLVFYNQGAGSLIRLNDNEWTFLYGSATNANGLRMTTRTASNLSKTYENGVETDSSTTVSNSLATIEIYVGARNSDGSVNSPSDLEQQFCSIGDGLDSTESLNLYNAVQTFNTTLSRQG